MNVTTLRRELREINRNNGLHDCGGCGFPSYRPPFNVRMIVRGTSGPDSPKSEPSLCEVCGRPKLKMKVRGLHEKHGHS